MTLFGKRVFADVIKDPKMGSSWIMRVGSLNSKTGILIRREKDTQKYREGQSPRKDRGRDWSDAASAKEHPDYQKLEETRKDSALRAFGRNMAP